MREAVEGWAYSFGERFDNLNFKLRLGQDRKTGVARRKIYSVIFFAPIIGDVAGEAVTVSWVQILVLRRDVDLPSREFELAFHRSVQTVAHHRMA